MMNHIITNCNHNHKSQLGILQNLCDDVIYITCDFLTNDDIYNIMAQNSTGHILGISGEFAINFDKYDLSFGLIMECGPDTVIISTPVKDIFFK